MTGILRFSAARPGLLRTPIFQAVTLAVFYALVVTAVSLIRHMWYGSNAFDLGIYTQTLWYTLQGMPLYNSAEGMSHLGYHFSPILFLLVPPFLLFPDSGMLLVVQSAALGIGGFLMYKVARVYLDHRHALAVELLFFLSPLVNGTAFFDFHPVGLALFTLPLMLFGLVTGRWVLFSFGLLLSLTTRQDVAASLAIFGASMLAAEYVRTRRLARVYAVILVAALATGAFALLLAVLISGKAVPPMIGYLGSDVLMYAGESPWSMASDALRNFFDWRSLRLALLYLLPLGFLPLLSLVWALPALFILFIGMVASMPGPKQLLQYPAPAVPFLFAGFIMALHHMGNGTSPFRFLNSERARHRAVVFAISTSLLILVAGGITGFPKIRSMAITGPYRAAIESVIALVPTGATVLVPGHIHSHLSARTYAFTPYDVDQKKFAAEYVIVDTARMADYQRSSEEQRVNWLEHLNDGYAVLARVDGVVLLNKGFAGTPVFDDLSADWKSAFG